MEFFIEKCNYCDEFSFDARSKSRHILKNHLKILNIAQVGNMIVRIEFIEFTIDSKRFSKFYDFTKPGKDNF